jgi:transcriptional regulator with XRE-family HTH domain
MAKSTRAREGRFNTKALFDAMDQQRRERGITWQQVARETGVSPGTLTRTKLGGRMEVDGMLSMVRWLNRTVESFVQAAPDAQRKTPHAD